MQTTLEIQRTASGVHQISGALSKSSVAFIVLIIKLLRRFADLNLEFQTLLALLALLSNHFGDGLNFLHESLLGFFALLGLFDLELEFQTLFALALLAVDQFIESFQGLFGFLHLFRQLFDLFVLAGFHGLFDFPGELLDVDGDPLGLQGLHSHNRSHGALGLDLQSFLGF